MIYEHNGLEGDLEATEDTILFLEELDKILESYENRTKDTEED